MCFSYVLNTDDVYVLHRPSFSMFVPRLSSTKTVVINRAPQNISSSITVSSAEVGTIFRLGWFSSKYSRREVPPCSHVTSLLRHQPTMSYSGRIKNVALFNKREFRSERNKRVSKFSLVKLPTKPARCHRLTAVSKKRLKQPSSKYPTR